MGKSDLRTTSGLKIEYVETEKLIPYVMNSRTHSETQVMQIASSIKEFGFTNPILIDETQTLIAGHGRLLAAKTLSLSEVPCITLHGLSPAQKKAYVIADNKIALNAGWDVEALKTEILALEETAFDLQLLGFEIDELKAIIDDPMFDPATENEQGQLDELDPKWIVCPKCGSEFDARTVGA